MAGSGMTTACIARLNKEMRQLEVEPPPGVSAWPKDNKINNLEGLVQGPAGTPYEGGTFKLEILVPDRYPFEPPKIRFLTPIYHPNIDSGGRICLDTLNMPPKGQWKPAVNLSTLLATIQQLLGDPNPDDGLDPEITREYKHDRMKFEAEAKARTIRYAVDSSNSTLQQAEGEKTAAPSRKEEKGRTAVVDAESDEEDSEEEDEEDEEEALASLWGKTNQSQSSQQQQQSSQPEARVTAQGEVAKPAIAPGGSVESSSRPAERASAVDEEEEMVADSEEEEDDIFTQSFLGSDVGGASAAGTKRPFPGAGRQGGPQQRQRT